MYASSSGCCPLLNLDPTPMNSSSIRGEHSTGGTGAIATTMTHPTTLHCSADWPAGKPEPVRRPRDAVNCGKTGDLVATVYVCALSSYCRRSLKLLTGRLLIITMNEDEANDFLLFANVMCCVYSGQRAALPLAGFGPPSMILPAPVNTSGRPFKWDPLASPMTAAFLTAA